MIEGTVVVVTNKLESRVRDVKEELIMGTVIGTTKDKKIMVLLPDGLIHTTEAYNLTLPETQCLSLET